MKVLLITEDREPFSVIKVLVHPTDHDWTVESLDVEYKARYGFVAPIYKIADDPTSQQVEDGLRTQAALYRQALARHNFPISFNEWLTAERGFQPVIWEEI